MALVASMTVESISIHTPARGVTYTWGKWKRIRKISIHTPARGVTDTTTNTNDSTTDFNPHSREGSDILYRYNGSCHIISIHTPARGVTAILSKNCKHFYFICTTIEPNHKQTRRPGTALIHKSNKFVYLFGASLPAFLCLLAVRTYPKRSMSDLRQLLCPLPNALPLSDTYFQDNKTADCQPSHR